MAPTSYPPVLCRSLPRSRILKLMVRLTFLDVRIAFSLVYTVYGHLSQACANLSKIRYSGTIEP